MQLHTLQPRNAKKVARRIGRGGKRGKTSGRGGKGQTARAGSRLRPEWRDTIKRIPKRRGYGKNRADTVFANRPRPVAIAFALIVEKFEAGATITPAALIEKGLVERKRGIMPMVKILGSGDIAKKYTVQGCQMTGSAKAALEKAGGTILAAKTE